MQTIRKIDTSIGWMLDDGAKTMFLIFSAIAIIICLLYQIRAVTYPYQLDYGEAPLVDQAIRLASGQNIYRADISTPPYTISNYPPVYVALLALSVKLFGPASTFFVGRIVSIFSAWMACAGIAYIVYTSTRDHVAAVVAGVLLLSFPYVVYWSPLLRIDMLALALSMCALALLVTQPVTTKRLFLVSLLLVAAIYTRQSYALAAPLAAFVWLLAQDWRKAFRLAMLAGGSSLILFLVINGLTRGGFYFNIVTANVNEFRMDNLKYHWDGLREVAIVPLIFGGVSLFLSRRLNPLWMLTAPYLFAAALSAATIGKIGSNVNYLLELCAALSLTAGIVIASSRAHASFQSTRALVLIALAVGIGRMIHFTLQDYTGDLRDRRATIREISRLATLVAETPGNILADEYMGMLTLQGRPLSIQPFEVTQLAWAGKWDQTPLINSINNKEYSAIIIYDKPWAKERWTQEMFDAINGSYILSSVVAGNRIYIPYQVKPVKNLQACPGAAWRLPSDSTLGLQRENGGLNFFGQGNVGEIPVYAVADGLLTRLPEWVDAVAIQHDDPLQPDVKVWSYYSGMASANGIDSYVTMDFPSGVENVPVKAGQVLGYQGSWSGDPQWPMWIHVYFGLVRTAGQFPGTPTIDSIVDPSPYLGLHLKSQTETPNMQPLNCSNGQ